MAVIGFDFSLLTKPYRLKRCTHQLVHLALAAKAMGHKVKAITSEEHLKEHKIMRQIEDIWSFDRDGLDIYVAKADAYYNDSNWASIAHLPAFKVCMCNSDLTFRESSAVFRHYKGTPVQTRCDLYMPCNYRHTLMAECGHKVVPTAHPIDTRMADLFARMGLRDAYLNADVSKIRKAFCVKETRLAGFMGSPSPTTTRKNESTLPRWVDISWCRSTPSIDYIKWMLERRAVVDLRGYGDKSIRMTEGVLFGRTILSLPLYSQYSPALVDRHNCIIVNDWSELDGRYDGNLWKAVAEQATVDYVDHWSVRGQIRTILNRAGYG